MKWEIQEFTVFEGWVNTWTDGDDKSVVFDTKEDAETALTDYLDDINQAVKDGDMVGGYNRDGFRVVPIEEPEYAMVRGPGAPQYTFLPASNVQLALL
jgi:hypothetical protein